MCIRDRWEFEQEARLADQPGTPAEERIPHARRALKLYTGDLLQMCIRDRGFVACADGTFDVYCAGGLGANPKMGVLVDTGVAPRNVLYDVCACLLYTSGFTGAASNHEEKYCTGS